MLQQPQNDALVDERRAADILNAAPATLSRWRYAGKGPRFVKIGRLVRYSMRELERYISQQERSSTSENGASA
jgi:helix-turn-helix protein